jgi:alpha-N-arabinofuranosidase
MAALREQRYTLMRYPGGNFLSGYDWLDGVGTREQRPTRRDLAWMSIESNQFGTNEFMQFCKKIDAQPMLGVNLGTGSIQQAGNLVEYCNAPTGSAWSDLRASHGYAQPHAVKYWCLGNEMDGPWQIGHLDMHAYADKALEAAKIMKWHDPTIQTIVCGSSNNAMPTYPEWDRVVLEHTWDKVDYLSMHYYAKDWIDRNNREAGIDTGSFLALPIELDDFVKTLAGTLRYVKAKCRSAHDVYLSWDEWNVWCKDFTMDGKWQHAPHLIEEKYTLADALVVAQWLGVFLRNCDVLKIACIAQIVNIIAPLLTTRDGLLKQTTFYPFKMVSTLARGVSLNVNVSAPHFETQRFGAAPLVDAFATHDAAHDQQALFVTNRSQTDEIVIECHWQNGAPNAVREIWQVSGNDAQTTNTWEQPNVIIARAIRKPQIKENTLKLKLPPMSFTSIALS